ncbi:hypothetical protein LBWT_X1690 (plasmid) [Leptolyngbya boryana IAM M-101]|nr:hypothetical protein [Leptolyngbya sp. FACHB-402]BAS60097.1 hypothetical protein LBWT_X1690 [Leptolyngbya boryana IAM M-101]BAS66445.1 hypothetical protein LBDG_X1690 [Leptolyngbya boryana dg5]
MLCLNQPRFRNLICWQGNHGSCDLANRSLKAVTALAIAIDIYLYE